MEHLQLVQTVRHRFQPSDVPDHFALDVVIGNQLPGELDGLLDDQLVGDSLCCRQISLQFIGGR